MGLNVLISMYLMKLLLKVLIGGVLLMGTGFAQELKRDARPQEPVAESQASTEQIIATGVRHRPAPVVQPKALPPLNPSLGEIARRARAAHAEAPKAKLVAADDVPPQD
ncbi:MAG: hypothetical protein ACRD3W_11080 [Terriglobales bacterium]